MMLVGRPLAAVSAIALAFFALSIAAPLISVQAQASPVVSAGDTTLMATLLQRLRQHDAVKVQFTQLKTVRILKRPLQSNGSLLFRRGRGMVWKVVAPVPTTYVLTAQGMREINAESSAAAFGNSAASLSGNSSMPNLLPLFDAIFAGDEATLAQHFTYRVSGAPQQWQLSLLPRDAMLKRIFDRLELTGGDYIETVTLYDTRGDQTRIELRDPQFGTLAIDAHDHALLP